ncbi:hypothetical protein EGW08_022367 [Elysia chlorotica]|uniref:Major facilitator superfamily (MFS) profile domain-containing protein n=1 Tax=Elysia chlorotica TaxID=188477 RepID=A0A433SL55_ELYCH|nr:hypothetical protein EGW08_022367 [Elysia chlorotica]
MLTIALLGPTLFFVLYMCIIPESPRWLLSVGRQAEAARVLQKFARSKKGREVATLMENAVGGDNPDRVSVEPVRVWTLFSHWTLCTRILICAYNRFALSFVYYGISLNVGRLGGDLYVNYTLGCAVETVAYVLVLLCLFHWGRRKLYAGSMALGSLGFSLASLSMLISSSDDSMASVGLVMAGKLGVSAGYAVYFVHVSEMFPTSVRSTAVGLTSIAGTTGAAVSPYIYQLCDSMAGRMGVALPMLVYGAAALGAMVLTLWLPETRGRKMPDSVQEAVTMELTSRVA